MDRRQIRSLLAGLGLSGLIGGVAGCAKDGPASAPQAPPAQGAATDVTAAVPDAAPAAEPLPEAAAAADDATAPSDGEPAPPRSRKPAGGGGPGVLAC